MLQSSEPGRTTDPDRYEASGKLYPGYSAEERAQAPAEAVEITLGCGNPTAMASLKAGETVLDIGSGGGLDAFLAARQVGPTRDSDRGRYDPSHAGARQRQSAEQAGIDNVNFPLRPGGGPSGRRRKAWTLIISNCVINFTEDKGKVFREAFRVLKAGGRLEVSDIVSDRAFPVEHLQRSGRMGRLCERGAARSGIPGPGQGGRFRNLGVRRSASQDVDGMCACTAPRFQPENQHKPVASTRIDSR